MVSTNEKLQCITNVQEYCCCSFLFLGGGGDELVNKLHVADIAILIFSDSEEGKKIGGFFLFEFLSKGAQNVLHLSHGDLAGAVLVEDFEAFNIVFLAAGILQVGLHIGPNRQEFLERNSLLA